MTTLGAIAAIALWFGCCCAVFAAWVWLIDLLTGETVIDKGRWGKTEQVDHRSHSRTNVLDRTHDRDDF